MRGDVNLDVTATEPHTGGAVGATAFVAVHKLSGGELGARVYTREPSDYRVKSSMTALDHPQPRNFVRDTFKDALRFIQKSAK